MRRNQDDDSNGININVVLLISMLFSTSLVGWHFLTVGVSNSIVNNSAEMLAAQKAEKEMSKHRRLHMQAFNRARRARALMAELK